MNKKYIAMGWESYRKHVLPADAPEIQIKECKQAFFSGGAILYTAIMNVLSPGQEPTEADVQILEDLHAEVTEIGNDMDKAAFGSTEH